MIFVSNPIFRNYDEFYKGEYIWQCIGTNCEAFTVKNDYGREPDQQLFTLLVSLNNIINNVGSKSKPF